MAPSATKKTVLMPESLLAASASAIADKSRAKMLCVLMDGRAWTATELSAAADISASTASAHLARLLDQQFVVCLAQGRHRYYRLASSAIAGLLEQLMGIAWAMHPQPPTVTTPLHLRYARTCYDHMAGTLAVHLYQQMEARCWLTEQATDLTTEGKRALAALGIALPAHQARRKYGCACLDWSERRAHLGGALGAALLTHFETQGWVARQASGRALVVTPRGIRALQTIFGSNIPRPDR